MTNPLVSSAELFARHAHRHQTRKGPAAEPYFVHLEEVSAFVALHGGDDIAVAAAWLHDTVEDCAVLPEDLVRRFGSEVAAIVAELTDDKSLEKADRKALQIAHAPGKSARATLCKIGDKWSNVGSVVLSPPADWSGDRRRAYVDWAVAVVDALPRHWPNAHDAFLMRARDARETFTPA